MPVQAVVYISKACPEIASDPLGLNSRALEAMVDDAARFNRDAGVTGVLLFDGRRFLQYMEGPEDGLRVAYSRVLNATSHVELVELRRGRVGTRRLPFWPMQWLPVDPEKFDTIARSDWLGFSRQLNRQSSPATGMDHLAATVEPYISAA